MKYRFECARKSKWLTNREFLSRRFRVYTSCIQMSTIAQLPSSSWCADKARSSKISKTSIESAIALSNFSFLPLKSFLLRSRAVLDGWGSVMGFLVERMLNVFFTSSNLTRVYVALLGHREQIFRTLMAGNLDDDGKLWFGKVRANFSPNWLLDPSPYDIFIALGLG